MRLAIVGPTASGKTALAVALARRLGNAALLSADARQVYRGMDVGTAKAGALATSRVPGLEGEPVRVVEGVEQFLVDVADPRERFTAAAWASRARRVAAALERAGVTPVLVGGTGLYVEALVRGFDFGEDSHSRGRPDLRAELDALPDEALARRLAEVAPDAGAHSANRRRARRALEARLLGARPGLGAPPWPARVIRLDPPREALHAAAAHRLADMIRAGLLDEIRALLDRVGPDALALQAIGYKEFLPAIAGTRGLDASVADALRNTMSLARRQRAYFRARFPEAETYQNRQPLDRLLASGASV